MRTEPTMRKRRSGRMAVGAVMLGVPASAVALTAGGRAVAEGAARATPPSVQANLRSHRLAYGKDVIVSGTAPASDVGHTLTLDFAPAGSSSWRGLVSTRVSSSGQYGLAAPLTRSGLVKVVDVSAGPATSVTSGARATVLAASPGTDSSSSAMQRVWVAAGFRVRTRTIQALEGASAHVRGRLLPGIAGRRVILQGRTSGRWHTLTAARTGAWGAFDLRYRGGGPGLWRLRVRFAGDRLNASASARAGQLSVFRQSVASWYDDQGATACGFHAYYGVANRTLPCGTRVTFHYGSRTVTTVVQDRGPYIGGREWDLNQNTAAALGFDGVGTVWSSA